ncbi:MAG: hypothetical protein WAO37_09475, partial [Thermacetogeniaceae bacterium]
VNAYSMPIAMVLSSSTIKISFKGFYPLYRPITGTGWVIGPDHRDSPPERAGNRLTERCVEICTECNGKNKRCMAADMRRLCP